MTAMLQVRQDIAHHLDVQTTSGTLRLAEGFSRGLALVLHRHG